MSQSIGVSTTSPPEERAAASPPAPGAGPPQPSLARSLVKATRPKQFVKNVLVFAAPVAGGVLGDDGVLLKSIGAFVVFCLLSAATYLINDIGDVEADRRHPTKQHRPIAAGHVTVPVAVVAAVGLLAVGLALGFAISWQLGTIAACYKALTLSYTRWLKHMPVIDIAVVASGFIVRAVAGGAATDVHLSRWFLIVTCFGSLFMVAGKRHGEYLHSADGSTRAALAEYSLEYLRFVWTMAAAITIGAYCQWAFEHPNSGSGIPWWGLSIVPAVLALLRYALIIERGEAGSPEEVVLGDRTLQVFGAMWLIVFACSVYVS